MARATPDVSTPADKRSHRLTWIVAGLFLVVLVSGGWWYAQPRQAQPPADEAAPQPEAPAFTVTELDETWYAVKRSNVRVAPGTEHEKVGRFDIGEEVAVTGRVTGKDWVRVELADGETGYVYAPLLGEEMPAETEVALGTDGTLEVGRRFKDCPDCPEMVVVPAGSFVMGSPASEAGRYPAEGPPHRVTISQASAVGVFEVTRGEWLAFVRETERGTGDSCWIFEGGEWKTRSGRSWRSPGFSQSDDHPVVCVSWNDAQAYLSWLSRKTAKRYRLLSEAEWEYVARAGTRTSRYWGSSESGQCRHANGADFSAKERFSNWRDTLASCRDGHVHTSPVGSFAANGFGLHDVHGNVWEWVEDCWNDSYAGAPSDGGAWTSGNCNRRILRGGSWLDRPWDLRSAYRDGIVIGDRYDSVGFRVARTL